MKIVDDDPVDITDDSNEFEDLNQISNNIQKSIDSITEPSDSCSDVDEGEKP